MARKKDKKQQDQSTGPRYAPTIRNRKARHEYQLIETLEAGIALVGTEVKSLRNGKASLDEAFARIQNDELFLFGCTIPVYEQGNIMNHDPQRRRKLLVHRREIAKLKTRLAQKGLTLIPLKIYFRRGLAKIELAVAQGKTHGDKRQSLKQREHERDIRRATQFRR